MHYKPSLYSKYLTKISISFTVLIGLVGIGISMFSSLRHVAGILVGFSAVALMYLVFIYLKSEEILNELKAVDRNR